MREAVRLSNEANVMCPEPLVVGDKLGNCKMWTRQDIIVRIHQPHVCCPLAQGGPEAVKELLRQPELRAFLVACGLPIEVSQSPKGLAGLPSVRCR